MFYSISSISYCFPFDTSRHVLNRVFKSVSCEPELYGVLAPYIEKKMTEQEADDFLCEVIRKHPYIKDAMWLEIMVEWYDGSAAGIYQVLTIRNPNHGDNRRKYEPTPIQWR
jgi:hypothetical protein